MSSTEMIVIVGGLFLGYWIVSNLLNTKSNKESNTPLIFENPGASQSANEKGDDLPSSWFRILGIPETATVEEITAAYKQQISQYHPDKVASLGAELRELAEFKSKQINAAYDYAKKLRGQA